MSITKQKNLNKKHGTNTKCILTKEITKSLEIAIRRILLYAKQKELTVKKLYQFLLLIKSILSLIRDINLL